MNTVLFQGIKAELDVVQEELTGTRKDKFMLQAKVVELRNSMKTLLQQNQQLKLELKQSRNRKVSSPPCSLQTGHGSPPFWGDIGTKKKKKIKKTFPQLLLFYIKIQIDI